MRPLNNYIEVELKKIEEKSAIILPDQSKAEKNDLIVKTTYKGCESCKKGDKLIIKEGYLEAFKLSDKELYFVHEDGIIAVI